MSFVLFRGAATPASSKREQTHSRIVEAAARALRREGFAGVGVAEVMKQAGLTHGGFHAHFASREALLLDAYLSPEHVEATEEGCLVGALGAEMARQDAILLEASRYRVRRLIERVGAALPQGVPPGQAVALADALVGTLQVARIWGARAPGGNCWSRARPR